VRNNPAGCPQADSPRPRCGRAPAQRPEPWSHVPAAPDSATSPPCSQPGRAAARARSQPENRMIRSSRKPIARRAARQAGACCLLRSRRICRRSGQRARGLVVSRGGQACARTRSSAVSAISSPALHSGVAERAAADAPDNAPRSGAASVSWAAKVGRAPHCRRSTASGAVVAGPAAVAAKFRTISSSCGTDVRVRHAGRAIPRAVVRYRHFRE